MDGLPPTSAAQVGAFLVWAEATRVLGALDRAWPGGVSTLPTDPAHERLQWHGTELDQLHRVLRLGEALELEQRRFAEAGLPRPDWTDVDAVRRYANLVDVAAAVDAHTTATLPLRRLESAVSTVAGRVDVAPCVPALLAAARERDPAAYATAYHRLARLVSVRSLMARRDALGEAVPPGLRAAVADPGAVGRAAGGVRRRVGVGRGRRVGGGAGRGGRERVAGGDRADGGADPPRGRDPGGDAGVAARGVARPAHRSGAGEPGALRVPGAPARQGHRQVRGAAARRGPAGDGPLPVRRAGVDHAGVPDRGAAADRAGTCSTW